MRGQKYLIYFRKYLKSNYQLFPQEESKYIELESPTAFEDLKLNLNSIMVDFFQGKDLENLRNIPKK